MEAWELMVAAYDLGKKRGTNKRIKELNPDKRMEPHQVVLEGKKAETRNLFQNRADLRSTLSITRNSFPEPMASPFVLIIPGYPMITQFQQIESTRCELFHSVRDSFVTSLPNPASIAELCFSVNPNIQIPECGSGPFSYD